MQISTGTGWGFAHNPAAASATAESQLPLT